jgi:hypothetical protein
MLTSAFTHSFWTWQIVFSQAWWVGRKEENPQELKLDFPKELQNVCSLRVHLFLSHSLSLSLYAYES